MDEEEADWKAAAKPGCLVFVLGAAVLFFVGGNCVPEKSSQAERAYYACEGFVGDRLKAPSTARFSGVEEASVSRSQASPKWFTVRGWVDSQNGFGAQMRNDFSCVVEETSDGWSAVAVDVDSG